jgi:hypothetical protein
VALLLPVAAVWPLVRRTATPGPDPVTRIVIETSLAAGLGLGLSSCAFFAASQLWSPSRQAAVISDLALVTLAIGALGVVRRARAGRPAPVVEAAGAGAAALDRALGAAVGGAGLAAIAVFAVRTLGAPHGEGDAWAVWSLRARFLFRGGEHWRDLFSPQLPGADYPLLLPGAVARGWLYAGSETVAVPIAVWAMMATATVGVLGAGVGLLRGRDQGLVAALVLLGTPAFVRPTALHHADVPLGFFILSALALLCARDRTPAPASGLSALAGLALGLGAWLKHEGSLAAISVLLGRGLAVAMEKGWKAAISDARPILLGLLPAALLVAHVRIWLAPPSPWLTDGSPVSRLLDLGRAAQAARFLAWRLLTFDGAIVSSMVLLVVCGALLGRRPTGDDRLGARTCALALGGSLAGYLAASLTTPYPLGWELTTSLHRLLLQLWPSAIFLYCLVVRAPSEALRATARPAGARGRHGPAVSSA